MRPSMKQLSSRLKRRFHPEEQDSTDTSKLPGPQPEAPSAATNSRPPDSTSPGKASEQIYHPAMSSSYKPNKHSWKPSMVSSASVFSDVASNSKASTAKSSFGAALPREPPSIYDKACVRDTIGRFKPPNIGSSTASGANHGIPPSYPEFGSLPYQGSDGVAPIDYSSIESQVYPPLGYTPLFIPGSQPPPDFWGGHAPQPFLPWSTLPPAQPSQPGQSAQSTQFAPFLNQIQSLGLSNGMPFPQEYAQAAHWYGPKLPSGEPVVRETVTDDETSYNNRESSEGLEQPVVEGSLVEEVSKALEPLQQFVRRCVSRQCAKCHQKLAMGIDDVGDVASSWATIATSPNISGAKDQIVVLGWKCQDAKCPALTCPGCGSDGADMIVSGQSSTFQIAGVKVTTYWCCDEARLAAIWALGCGYNTRSMSKPPPASQATNGTGEPAESSLLPAARPKGVGYGGKSKGYSHPTTFYNAAFLPVASPAPQKTVNSGVDIRREAKFRLMASLLPSYKLGNFFDMSPPDLVPLILSRSLVVEQAAAMLSNDSIDEIAMHRYGLYDAMLDFFDAVGDHYATAGLAYNKRELYHRGDGRLLFISYDMCKSKARMVSKDTGKSLLELLGKLAAQAQTVVRHASANPAVFSTREGQQVLKLSERLVEVSATHTASAQRLQTEMDTSPVEPKINFAEWHSNNCVSDVPDERVLHNFTFSTQAERGVATAPATYGRMRRLITELSTLQTSLPEGIFIRHGSSRLDVMKVLIIGPKGTPYEHGLFEFDLWCTQTYPKDPPFMKFKTTNGGKVRFNPNLYEDGTICLSLLGTWAGEPWRANQSTILQVLVSIQSMIFCEHPWYNEPGRENSDGKTGKTQSARYNNEVRNWTLRHALLPWVDPSSAKGKGKRAITAPNESLPSLWQETAQVYLQANAKDVIESSRLAALNCKSATLQDAVKTVSAAFRAQGYSH
ncbi:hypothetical protein Hte_005893 [Hypoxylon texense]